MALCLDILMKHETLYRDLNTKIHSDMIIKASNRRMRLKRPVTQKPPNVEQTLMQVCCSKKVPLDWHLRR